MSSTEVKPVRKLPKKPTEFSDVEKRASHELCLRLEFRHLFLGYQKELFDTWASSRDDSVAIISRKSGKSYCAILYAIWFCMSQKRRIVRYIGPTLKGTKDLFFPILHEILAILPRKFKPQINKTDGSITFENGSKIVLGGSQKETQESSRGPYANLIILDEVLFFERETFEYFVESVLRPQMTLTKGVFIFISTPPKIAVHPFLTRYYPRLQGLGTCIIKTVYESPLLSDEDIEKIADRIGGKESLDFQREYLCALLSDNSLRLTPEFNKHLHVREELAPLKDPFGEHYKVRTYTSIDVGLTDCTAVLIGYFDHMRGKLVIVDEYVGTYKTLKQIVDITLELESTLENVRFDTFPVFRIMDLFEVARYEMTHEHNFVTFRPSKDKVPATIAVLRNALEKCRVEIHARCKRLIADLEFAVWDEKLKDIERNESEEGTVHADALMALAYLVGKTQWSLVPNNTTSASTVVVNYDNKPKKRVLLG